MEFYTQNHQPICGIDKHTKISLNKTYYEDHLTFFRIW